MALLIPQYQAYAHPHVWVQVRTEIVYGPNETILGVRHNWTFDELYTTFALQGMDQNGDGTYDQKELAPLLKVNIDSLKEFGYFTFSKTGGNPISHLEPQQAEIKLDNFLISLSFFLPLEKPIKADAAAYSFSVYDPSYYISFTFENEMPMQLTSATPKGCQTQLIAPQKRVQNLMNMSESDFQALGVNFNFGGQFAQKVVLQCALG
ncbi:MAG: DUF1007 family protein [Pseudomonadota bacterium]